mgnify:CR=1 FL=1
MKKNEIKNVIGGVILMTVMIFSLILLDINMFMCYGHENNILCLMK